MPAISDNNQAKGLFLCCLSQWVEMPDCQKLLMKEFCNLTG